MQSWVPLWEKTSMTAGITQLGILAGTSPRVTRRTFTFLSGVEMGVKGIPSPKDGEDFNH